MQNTDFLMILILTHLLSDFVFQTSKIAESKAKSTKGVIGHVAIVFVINAIFLSNYGMIAGIVTILTTASHFVIDYVKMQTRKYYSITTIQSLIDQIIHFIVIIILDYSFRNIVNEPILKLEYIGLINYLIFITYVSTVITKMVLWDLCVDKHWSCGFFKKYERPFDCIAILTIVLSFIYTALGIIVLIIVAVVFYFVQTKHFKYSQKQTILKVIIYLIFVCAFRFFVY